MKTRGSFTWDIFLISSRFTYCVDSQGGTVNFTINNVCNIIVAPNTFVPPSVRPPQEDIPTYNNHQNEGASRSSGNEPRGPDESTQTAETTEAQTAAEITTDAETADAPMGNAETADAGGAQFGVSQLVAVQLTDVQEADAPIEDGDAPIGGAHIADTQLIDVEMDDAPIDNAQLIDGQLDDIRMGGALSIDVQMDTTPITDGLLVDELLADTPMGDTSSTNVHLAQNLDSMTPTFERDHLAGPTNSPQTSQNNDVVVAEGSGSTLPVTRSVPVTPSIPRQNRKRRAETDDGLCLPTPRSVYSTDVFINSIPTYTFSYTNVYLTDPQDVSILESEARKLNVTISNVMTEKMPVGQNRYIQHFQVQNRSEKECNKLDWKEKWRLSEIIKNTATPFFAHHITLEVKLRFIMYTTKFPERESYRSFYSKSQCKMHVKECLSDNDLIREIEKNLNEKGGRISTTLSARRSNILPETPGQ
ncbi:hypothetical protein CRE_11339 [Caenorhabditis remanei]|uniref:Uncharacterized protein n=1 Tax=Caenorhabditis remanei TaxID=31234 RepID=E3N0E8_CAERE|nr:hypothetical protein CRE_11339 [Caenorhabditis remanei]